MKRFSARKKVLQVCVWMVAAICSGYVSVGVAGTHKRYINKEQSASNVIVFDETLTATVKHTAEGMELTLPG